MGHYLSIELCPPQPVPLLAPQCGMVSVECVKGAGGPSDMTVVEFIPQQVWGK